ncbi:MAG: glycosyltransferase family A protein [Ferruginibacter sp.]
METSGVQYAKPLVSVLMTCYNRENYISDAIESVLRSSYKNFELIIVDDGSKDKTISIAEDYAGKDQRIRFYRNEKNLGDYHNRNKAASYAEGKYMIYLDSDDIMYDFALEFAVRYMEMFPDAGFGMPSFYDKKAPYPFSISPKEIYEDHYFRNMGHFSRSPASGIIKVEVFKAVKGFSGKRLVGDMEFWMKISRYYRMVKYPTPHFWYRSDNADKESSLEEHYAKLRNELQNEALAHPECPLDKKDSKRLLKEVNRNRYLQLLFKGWNKLKGKFR